MTEVSKPQFLISNLSLPKGLLYGGSVSDHEQYMERVGADGLELTPVHGSHFMRRLLQRAEMVNTIHQHPVPPEAREYMFMEHGLGYVRKDWSGEDEAFRQLVRAQHSSFRNTANDDGLLARTVPKWPESLHQMRRIQGLTGKLPAVLYPDFENGNVIYSEQNAPFAQRTFQPKVSNLRRMNLSEDSTTEDIHQTMQRQGFTGLTWDVLHSQTEEDGRRFKDPVAFAGRLAAAGLIPSLHLSLNRLDSTGFHSSLSRNTRQARRAFTTSPAAAKRTIEGEMLSVIVAESPAVQHIVLEDGPFRMGNVRRDHAAIIAHARELVA